MLVPSIGSTIKRTALPDESAARVAEADAATPGATLSSDSTPAHSPHTGDARSTPSITACAATSVSVTRSCADPLAVTTLESVRASIARRIRTPADVAAETAAANHAEGVSCGGGAGIVWRSRVQRGEETTGTQTRNPFLKAKAKIAV